MTYNKYYNSYRQRIKNVYVYASTGAPMYKNFTNKYGEKIHVTQKFKPKSITKLDKVPGYFAKEVEQEYTDYYIDKYGYDKVRGGKYTNSYTLNAKKYNYTY